MTDEIDDVDRCWNSRQSEDEMNMTIHQLMKSLEKLNFSNALTRKALTLTNQLTDWLLALSSPDTPTASITLSRWSIAIEIGEHVLWDSECDSEEDLTFDKLVANYEKYLTDLLRPRPSLPGKGRSKHGCHQYNPRKGAKMSVSKSLQMWQIQICFNNEWYEWTTHDNKDEAIRSITKLGDAKYTFRLVAFTGTVEEV